eukprot:Skav205130  [mRNA]  locus=scaffold3411:24706:26586:- [translate_table: standard]
MPGPMCAFVQMVQSLGGAIRVPTCLITLGGITFDWRVISSRALANLLSRVWIQHVSEQRIDRKHFDISTFDPRGNHLACKDLSYRARTLVDAYMSGRHIANEILAKFIPTKTAVCPFCQQQDGREHRLFQCKGLNQIRSRTPEVKKLQRMWKEANWYFALCPKVTFPFHLKQEILDAEIPFSIPHDHERVTVFTDGTCYFSEFPDFAIAAGAYVVPNCDGTRCRFSKGSLVAGLEQNSFTGEMWGVLLCLNRFFNVDLHCDCEALCNLIQQALDCEDSHDMPMHQCQYIWQPISQHLAARPKGAVTITKVKAHLEICEEHDTHKRWLIKCNAMVDRAAKRTVTHQNAALYNRLQKLADKQTLYRRQIKELVTFIAETADLQLQHEVRRQKEACTVNSFDPNVDRLLFPTRTITYHKDVDSSLLRAFPWGPVFFWRLQWYFSRLGWPKQDHDKAHERDVSFVELYVDFVLTTNTRTPRCATTASMRQQRVTNWVLDDIHIQGDTGAAIDLASQTRVWTRALGWVSKHAPGLLMPGFGVKRSYSLNTLGNTAWLNGWSPRPKLLSGSDAAQWLYNFFHTARGVDRNLGRCFDLPHKPWLDHPATIDTPIAERMTEVQNAVDIFKSAVF